MKGIGYFQNLRNFLDISENFWEKFLGGFFGRIFLEDLLRGILWEEFFVYIGIDLFVEILVFVKILSKSKEEEEFRSLEGQVQAYRT